MNTLQFTLHIHEISWLVNKSLLNFQILPERSHYSYDKSFLDDKFGI